MQTSFEIKKSETQNQTEISVAPANLEHPSLSPQQIIEEPKENLWYLRIMHGVKAGATIGAPAGTIATPVIGTAIGTLGGALLGGILFFILGLPGVRDFLEKYFPKLYADIDGELEKREKEKLLKETVVKQSFFRLSRSNFAKWDMRFLMGAMAGAGAGAAIGTIFPVIGTAIGAVVGGVLGAVAAVAHNQIVKKFAPETAVINANNAHEHPHWYAETQHDIPWYIRLTCGEAAGLALGAATGAFVGTIIFPGIGTAVGAAMGGAIGALAGGGLAWISPMVFAGFRQLGNFISNTIVNKIKRYSRFKNEVDIEMVELNKRDDKNWPDVLKEDTYDLPWYVRAFAGASAGALIGAAAGAFFPGFGTVIGGFAGAVVGAGLSIASPAAFAFIRTVITEIKNTIFPADTSQSALELENNHQPNANPLSAEFDIPWYFRGFFGASVGAAMGAAIGTVIFPGIGTAAGTAFGTLIGAGVFIALPTIKAVYSTVSTKISACVYGAKDTNNDESSSIPPELTHSGRIPWTVRAMGASIIGGLVGGAIGSIIPVIGTAIGTGVGALLFTAIYVAVPALFDLVDRKLFARKNNNHLNTNDQAMPPAKDEHSQQQNKVVMRADDADHHNKAIFDTAQVKSAINGLASTNISLKNEHGHSDALSTAHEEYSRLEHPDALGGWVKDEKYTTQGEFKYALLAGQSNAGKGKEKPHNRSELDIKRDSMGLAFKGCVTL